MFQINEKCLFTIPILQNIKDVDSILEANFELESSRFNEHLISKWPLSCNNDFIPWPVRSNITCRFGGHHLSSSDDDEIKSYNVNNAHVF